MGVPRYVAQRTLREFAKRFKVYWQWAESRIDQGLLTGTLETVFGWPLQVRSVRQHRTARNFSMQGNGAEMLRLAISLAYERGIEVVAPVHDAVMIESGASDITDAVDAMQQCMAEASKTVLDGYPIATDAEITVWPDRCTDARGADLWGQLTRLLRP